jgi:ornithine decarboxylase
MRSYSLASKFGADRPKLKALLMAARQASDALGICFHVGSQAMTRPPMPRRWSGCAHAIVEAAVTVDIVDVGGGFPSTYPGMEPPPLEAYFEVIHSAFEALPISYSAELWCEPGRALCAEYASLSCALKSAAERALHQRRRLWRAVRCRACRLAFPGEALRDRPGTSRHSASTGRPATISTIWRGRSTCPPMSGRRLYRDRNARRLWLRDAHPVQRLWSRSSKCIVDDEPMATLYGAIREQAARSNVVTL